MILSFGYICMELQTEIACPLKFPSAIKSNNYYTNIGGGAANQVISAARCGAKTSLIGAIGNDIFGKEILTTLRREGVQTSGIAKKDCSTSIINSIINDKGQKASIILEGANAEISVSQIPNHALNEKTLLLLQNDIDLDINIDVLKSAKKGGARSVMCINHDSNIDKLLFDYTDIAIVNDSISVPENKKIIITKHENKAFDIFCGYFAACLQAGMSLDKSIKYGDEAAKFETTPYLHEVEEHIKNLKP